jgi:hypothetical protein
MARTAVAVGRHGVTKGVAKAAAKVSPPMLVIEAAVAVVGAVGSFIDLASARAERDALRTLNAKLVEQLQLQRTELAGAIENAREALDQDRELREALEKVVALCRDAFSAAMRLCTAELARDLPDFSTVERNQERLVEAWGQLQRALRAYQTS